MSNERELTQKQRAILESALEVFAERGYAGAPTSEIARRAGVAEATIFKTWKTKKDLLVAVVAPVFFEVIAPRIVQGLKVLVEREWASGEEFLRALMRDRISFLREHHRILRVVLQELPFHPEVRRMALETLRTEVAPIVLPVVVALQRRGEFIAMPPERLMRLVGTNIAGWGIIRLVLTPEAAWNDDEEEQALLAFLVRALTPRAP